MIRIVLLPSALGFRLWMWLLDRLIDKLESRRSITEEPIRSYNFYVWDGTEIQEVVIHVYEEADDDFITIQEFIKLSGYASIS